jgi:predicted DNA-binding protein YlxM (UPF0122 family)
VRTDTNKLFYVGKGKGNRFYRTINRNQYFQNIIEKTDTFSEILIDDLTEQEAFNKERELILEYKQMGYKLANLTDGGDGVSGFKPSELQLKRNRSQYHGFDIEDFAEDIIELYIDNDCSTNKIAEKYKVSDVIIAKLLRRHGIETRGNAYFNKKLTGDKRYNSKHILIKDCSQNVVNCFGSVSEAGKWLATIGLVNAAGGGKKAIYTNLDTNINYKGLLFYTIDNDEYRKVNQNKDNFVEFVANDISNQSTNNSNIVEVYDINKKLIHTYPSIDLCARNVMDEFGLKAFSAGTGAIYRNANNGKYYKHKYTFEVFSQSEYNEKINIVPPM